MKKCIFWFCEWAKRKAAAKVWVNEHLGFVVYDENRNVYRRFSSSTHSCFTIIMSVNLLLLPRCFVSNILWTRYQLSFLSTFQTDLQRFIQKLFSLTCLSIQFILLGVDEIRPPPAPSAVSTQTQFQHLSRNMAFPKLLFYFFCYFHNNHYCFMSLYVKRYQEWNQVLIIL